MLDVRVIHQDVNDFIVASGERAEGDTLVVDASGGDDVLDFSGLGAAIAETASSYPDLIAIRLLGGDGSDRLIGTPFNDVLDGGAGDDMATGGDGATPSSMRAATTRSSNASTLTWPCSTTVSSQVSL